MATPINFNFLLSSSGIIFLLALIILFRRLGPKKTETAPGILLSPNSISAMAELLVIIPCRNEAFNLPNLLSSFIESKKAGLQILVVDDQSTDETASIAKKFGADVCVTSNRPEGWSGKNWACHQGYEYSRKIGLNYKYILFTDADTIHSNLGLINAISWLNTQSADLLTARPYHRNPSFWEQLMGPFYLLILLITNAKEMRPKLDHMLCKA